MSSKVKKYYVKTYGCAMNISDAEKVAAWYEEKGWQLAKKIEDADEIVIITCSVRQTAEDRVYGLINNLKTCPEQVEGLKIVVTGCMLRYPLKWLKDKMPQVDEFKKISDYILNTKYPPSLKLRRARLIHNTEKQALVPIMEGCNNFCSYCVVPYARGREVSRPMEEIVCEVEELAKRGYKEITLLGQNVNSYGREAKFQRSKVSKKNYSETLELCNFAALLQRLHEIAEINKISFLTSNPWDLTDDIIEAMKLPKIDRYLHLPVQSGDDEILKKMNRHYTAEQYLDLTKRIRMKIPNIRIGTDIIVGFPGETEEQFQNTVLLCNNVGFVKAYVSMYSPRLQTVAYKLADDIPHKEKRRRWKVLDGMINKKD